MSLITAPLNRFLETGAEFLFPSACSLCHSAIPPSCPNRMCAECLDGLDVTQKNSCELCSAVVGPNLATDNGCIHCRHEGYEFRSVASLGNYTGLLKKAVLQGKCQYDELALRSLAQLLSQVVCDRASNRSMDLIVPIPQHWSDRFLSLNQASMTIANQLSRLLKLPNDRHILRKRERTPKQHLLSPAARRKNLRSAFKVNRGIDLTGLSILLVDDVLTTGTTCQRATRVLLQAGAEEVRVAVLARGIGA